MAAADTQTELISGQETDRLFAPLLNYSHLALAVSGGSDSVALMVLAGRWRKRHPGAARLSVLTVDHGLRPEAADEARQVSLWAAALGLKHATLCWDGAKPQSGLQDAARCARYQLMSDWCDANNAEVIVTGHTLDDQAETFLMRLARGSGVDGLSGMTRETKKPWALLRPLLEVPRQRLQASLTAVGHSWFEDPSNEDTAFERVRMREALDVLRGYGIDAGAMANSASRLARARRGLERQTVALHERAVTQTDDGKFLLDLEIATDVPAEMRIRLLQKVIADVGGQTFLRLAAIERLDDWLMSGVGTARTLGGCRISRRKRSIVVAREPGRKCRKPQQA